MIDKSVSILGCGWMGQPLGRELARQDVLVRGSTTTREKLEDLREDGIEPYLLKLTPEIEADDVGTFFSSSILVLNVPPPRNVEDVAATHLRQIDAVRSAAADGAVEWILFASSTGVYPNVERRVAESDVPPGRPEALSGPRRPTGEALLAAEKRLMDDSNFATTVLRFGGLYGDDRHPGRFLAGRENLARPNAPVNLIHRDDCVGLLATIMKTECRNDVFNACADEHPTREELYTRAAEDLGLAPPTFDRTDSRTGKVVVNEKVKEQCGYEFQHPNPLLDLGS